MRRILGWILSALCLGAPLAVAEVIDLVTYFPATVSSGNGYFRSMTVGTDYMTEAPGDGTMLVSDRVGIGTAAPEGSLHIVGPDNQADNVQLTAGGESGAMRLTFGNGGRGAPSPEGTVSSGDKLVLWNAAGAGGHKAAIGINASQELWVQSSGNNPNNKIGFYTSSNSTIPVERLRVEATGRVGIGTAGAVEASALLELKSTDRGFMPPRMSSMRRRAISSPAAGLMVFDTTMRDLMFFNGARWIGLTTGQEGETVRPPIGAIRAWHKSMPGTPALPDGWVECNGQQLSDPASPYHGRNLPNLNGPSGPGRIWGRYLRGATASGTMQEASRHMVIGHSTDGFSGLDSPSADEIYETRMDCSLGVYPYESAFFGLPLDRRIPMQLYASRPVSMTVVWIMRVK